MSAVDLHGAAVGLLSSALTVDTDGDVTAVDLDHARYAVDQARLAGLDVAGLLDTQQWAYRPDLLLRIVCPEATWERECHLHAVWCARQVRHLWPREHRGMLRATLLIAWRFARGRATEEELAAARAAAWAAAGDAAWDAPRDAAGAAAGDAARAAAGAAQQRRLIARAVQLLDAGGEE